MRWQKYDAWSAEDIEFLEASIGDLTLKEIAASLGRSHGAVRQFCSERGLRSPRRAWGQAQRPWTPEEEAFLREVAPTTSHSVLGAAIGRSRTAVRTRCHILGIEGRSRTVRAPRGQDHPNWRGGTSRDACYRGDDWEEVRAEALERDGYACQDCGRFIPSAKGLVVHHVIPWRLRPINELRWLRTLCVACHLPRPEHWWTEIPEDVLFELEVEVSQSLAGVFPGGSVEA